MALIIACVMIVAMAMPAMAATTVNNGTPTHKYNVYQIFSGTQTTTAGDKKLGDVKWGTGISDPSALITALKANDSYKTGTPAKNIFADITYDSAHPDVSALAVAKALDGIADKSDIAKALANDVANYLSNTSVEMPAGASSSINLDPGYYLFLDTTTGITSDDALNSAILQVTATETAMTIKKKYTVPTVDKDIIGVNSTDLTSAPIEATDVNIGDTVKYQITGTLPSNYADYEHYSYKFTDTLTKGQAVPAEGIKVYLVNGETKTDVTGKFAISPSTAIDGTADSTVITITNADLKDTTNGISGVTSESKIVVEYTVTITKDAVAGSTGQSNTAKITYDNNPNYTGNGTPPTSDTPEDKTLVFTYELDTTKVDGANANTKLKDAQFVLKATNGDHSGKYVTVAADGTIGWVDAKPSVVADGTSAAAAAATGVLISGSDGLFKVKGLDAGKYELEEIKAPASYNLLTSPIALEIKATVVGSDTATHDDDTPALTALSLDVTSNGTTTTSNGDTNTGIVSTNVENNGGTILPSTGGMGTKLIYIIGACIVVVAGVMLVTRRRMNAAK